MSQSKALTSPPTTTPSTTPDAAPELPDLGDTSVGEVARFVWEALGDNGYQTGCALLVATIALVATINLRMNQLATAVIAIGAFWAGWLGWNTLVDENNPLFPGEVSATKLWDIAFASDTGFLVVAIVASLTALVLWRASIKMFTRVVLIVGAVLGASLIYNVYESFQVEL